MQFIKLCLSLNNCRIGDEIKQFEKKYFNKEINISTAPLYIFL